MQQALRPEREEVTAELNNFFLILTFLISPFVTIKTMFLKYLRHKVDLVGCFNLKLFSKQRFQKGEK